MKKSLISLSLAITLLLCSTINVFATNTNSSDDTDSIEITYGYGYEVDPYKRLAFDPVIDEFSSPVSYDPRDNDWLTDVDSQGSLPLCWMYSATSAVEQYVAKNYGSKFNLSEVHGAVALSYHINKNNAALGYLKNYPSVSGTIPKAVQYLTNWNSPLFNSENYMWNSIVSSDDFPDSILKDNYDNFNILENNFSTAKSLFNITDIKYITNNMSSIKYSIEKYGAVINDIYMNSNYMCITDEGDVNYFSNSSGPNHIINIVGWDDNYSKDNFKGRLKPENNGAWLVKNSWGTGETYKDGYIWVSYEEPSLYFYLNNPSVIAGVQKSTDKEYMLSHDYFSMAEGRYSYSEKVYMANVYDISEFTDIYECINKVMFYIKAYDCTYNIKITQLEDGTMPTNTDDLTILAEGVYSGEGYVTAVLDDKYYFNSNGKCAVIIEIIPNSDNSLIYIPTETTNYSDVEFGESYYYIEDGSKQISWQDCRVDIGGNEGNICIRPVLLNEDKIEHYANISNSNIIDTSVNAELNIDSDSNLFYIHNNARFLRQDIDYIREGDSIILKNDYLESLNGRYTELKFEFSNDITKTVIVNPKSSIESLGIVGEPIIGETLVTEIVGSPEKDEYDVTYQWQISSNGITWRNIDGATNKDYIVDDMDIERYLRVGITSTKFGNVEYPLTVYSESTKSRVVYLGDVDLDGIVNIKDATMVQKYVASVIDFTKENEQILASDADKNGFVNVSDATIIQKTIVGIN